jgi:hypothetical protein
MAQISQQYIQWFSQKGIKCSAPCVMKGAIAIRAATRGALGISTGRAIAEALSAVRVPGWGKASPRIAHSVTRLVSFPPK